MDIWKKRPHRSEISGVYLGKEPSSAFFHHILPKNKYPEVRMDEENIILLTIDEHADVESDMYKFDIINQRRTNLLKKLNHESQKKKGRQILCCSWDKPKHTKQ